MAIVRIALQMWNSKNKKQTNESTPLYQAPCLQKPLTHIETTTKKQIWTRRTSFGSVTPDKFTENICSTWKWQIGHIKAQHLLMLFIDGARWQIIGSACWQRNMLSEDMREFYVGRSASDLDLRRLVWFRRCYLFKSLQVKRTWNTGKAAGIFDSSYVFNPIAQLSKERCPRWLTGSRGDEFGFHAVDLNNHSVMWCYMFKCETNTRQSIF